MIHKIDWQAKVEEFKQSGKSQIAWCREQGISPGTFQYHLKKTHSPGRFVELKSVRQGLKLHLAGICLELDPDFDEKTLKRFLQVARGLC